MDTNHNPEIDNDNQSIIDDDAAFQDAFSAATGEAAEEDHETSEDLLSDEESELDGNDDQNNDSDSGAKPDEETEKQETYEQLQARLAASENALKSRLGREKAFQRKADQLQAENERLKAMSLGDDSDDNSESSEDDEDDILKELGLSDVIEKKLQPIQEKLNKYEAADQEAADSLDAELEAEQLLKDQQSQMNAKKRIIEEHSDFDSVIADPDYAKWFYAQPESTRNMAESGDPLQVSGVITQFKESQKTNTRKRSKNLNSLSSISGRKAAVHKDDDEGLDFDAAFNRAIKS